MKRRQGFVSNSSSSSFCIYGNSYDEDELKDIYKKICEKDNIDEGDGIDNYSDLVDWFVEEFQTGYISFIQDYECERTYVGFDMSCTFNDAYKDMTLKELKEEIQKELKSNFFEKTPVIEDVEISS